MYVRICVSVDTVLFLALLQIPPYVRGQSILILLILTLLILILLIISIAHELTIITWLTYLMQKSAISA